MVLYFYRTNAFTQLAQGRYVTVPPYSRPTHCRFSRKACTRATELLSGIERATSSEHLILDELSPRKRQECVRTRKQIRDAQNRKHHR